MTPYRPELRAGRDGFAQLLRAEWTKFRTVRGWVIGMVVAAAGHRAARRCSPGRAASAACSGADSPSLACPAPPTGPGGEAVTDSFYFVHQPLAGNGSITVRVTSLTGLYSPAAAAAPAEPDGGHDARRAAVGQGRDHHQGEHPPGVGVRGDDGHRQPRGADAVRLHPRRGRAWPGRSSAAVAALAAADPLRRHDHRLRLGRRHALDQGRHRHAGRAAGHRAGRAVRHLARLLR